MMRAALRHCLVRGRDGHARKRRITLEVAGLEERALLSTLDPDLLTTATVNGAAVTSPVVTNAPSVTVSFSAVDPDDGPGAVLTTHFSVNGGAFADGNTLTLTNEGNYTVQYFSTDAVGDFEAMKTLLVTVDRTAPTLAITSVSPTTLWPPNGKLVPVTVTGTASDALSGVASPLTVQVQNEPGYQGGFVLPSSPVVVQPTSTNAQTGAASTGNFVVTVMLQARRAGFDRDGRQYTILVTSTDAAGNSSTVSTVVTVPHDQGHRNGGGPPGAGQGPGVGRRGPGGEQNRGHGNGGQKHGNGQNHGNGRGHVKDVGHGKTKAQGHGHGNGHGG